MEQYHQAPSVLPQFPATIVDGHPTPVANATPTQPQLSSSHPSYAEMITAAILWDSSQGKAGGSSKRAIAKYIDRVYTNLPPTHSALLTHHLKRLKNTGQLVMIKNSYQLPVVAATATTAAAPPPPPQELPAAPVPIRSAPPPPTPQSSEPANPTLKRRPGRPAKPKPLAQPTAVNLSPPPPSSAQQHPAGNGPSTGKRPRGRPPRQQLQQQQQPGVAEVPFVQPISQQVQAQRNYAPDLHLNNGLSVKRRPGRPSKKQQPVQPVPQAQFQPIDQGVTAVPVNGSLPGLAKRRPGRPPKAQGLAAPAVSVGGEPKRRGRPKRNALGPAARPIGKKPRGRPPRQPGAVPSGGVAGGKRRGRPPKGSVGPAKPVRKYAGKPLGRPRKNALITRKHASEHHEELIKKVEDMQVKMRDAVGVLKPFFTFENASNDALTALQILEDLSTLNVTAPPTPVEPPVSAMPVDAAVQPSTTEPAPETIAVQAVAPPQMEPPQPPVVPFSIAAPVMTEPAPYYPPPTMETQEQPYYMPSGEAQL